ncbi:hypothetical protein NYZ99_08410 [Maribacter litopenaei]|uniref:Transglutaminase-like domain-containing protein n=1 Tax=Maribacter litopenaei TaxID=2976127 RepID=A0ABY5YB09_9FLAO|nr:transglutaminase domain-containing protein [Maribacter litopenaei]UWX56245.1 hypothetical protein NYZ99_08410 [Maribacter litopenaei]
MKKRLSLLTIIFFSALASYSQSEKIQSLIKETKDTKLDMWDLTELVADRIKSKEEQANFFYHWIGNNISYDHQTFERIIKGTILSEEFSSSQDKYTVYENRKAVCAGYANLYKWFMDELEIEAVIISGHIRDPRNHYIDLYQDDNFRHGWNAIKLNDEWKLVDTTWGNSNDPTQSEYYFDINPEWLIITHYPEESKWQLLDEPLSLEEFNKSKYISPVWFHLGFSEAPKLMADDTYYYFAFKDLETDWSVNLQYSSDNVKFDYIRGIEVIKQDGMMYYRFEKEQIANEAFFKVGLTLLIEENNGYSTKQHKDVINFKI